MAKVHVGGADAWAPPVQHTMLGITVEEQVWVTFPGESEKDSFLRDHLDLCKMFQMMMCPCCCLYVPYASKSRKMEFSRECGISSCPYKVELDGNTVGRVQAASLRDNGFLFCLCPWLTCGGHIKIMGLQGADGQEKFVFLKELFPCWPCVAACGSGICGGFGTCLAEMDGCWMYTQGREFKSITQPVFKGPWQRGSGEPQKIGQFVITQRFTPKNLCCASPTPMQYFFEPTTPEGQNLAKEDRVALSLALQMYRGMPVPCKMCGTVDFQIPRGVWCLDCGLMTTTSWSSVQEALRRSS